MDIDLIVPTLCSSPFWDYEPIGTEIPASCIDQEHPLPCPTYSVQAVEQASSAMNTWAFSDDEQALFNSLVKELAELGVLFEDSPVPQVVQDEVYNEPSGDWVETPTPPLVGHEVLSAGGEMDVSELLLTKFTPETTIEVMSVDEPQPVDKQICLEDNRDCEHDTPPVKFDEVKVVYGGEMDVMHDSAAASVEDVTVEVLPLKRKRGRPCKPKDVITIKRVKLQPKKTQPVSVPVPAGGGTSASAISRAISANKLCEKEIKLARLEKHLTDNGLDLVALYDSKGLTTEEYHVKEYRTYAIKQDVDPQEFVEEMTTDLRACKQDPAQDEATKKERKMVQDRKHSKKTRLNKKGEAKLILDKLNLLATVTVAPHLPEQILATYDTMVTCSELSLSSDNNDILAKVLSDCMTDAPSSP